LVSPVELQRLRHAKEEAHQGEEGGGTADSELKHKLRGNVPGGKIDMQLNITLARKGV
jgi:hypothetical protein